MQSYLVCKQRSLLHGRSHRLSVLQTQCADLASLHEQQAQCAAVRADAGYLHDVEQPQHIAWLSAEVCTLEALDRDIDTELHRLATAVSLHVQRTADLAALPTIVAFTRTAYLATYAVSKRLRLERDAAAAQAAAARQAVVAVDRAQLRPLCERLALLQRRQDAQFNLLVLAQIAALAVGQKALLPHHEQTMRTGEGSENPHCLRTGEGSENPH